MLLLGVSLASDIDENVGTLSADLTFTDADRILLAEFTARALENKAIQALKTT